MDIISNIAKEISTHQKEILSDADLPESIAVYIFLKDEHAKNDRNDLIFQFVFRSFYGMDRAGLSSDLKKHFFKLLRQKEGDLKIILDELYEIPSLKKLNAVHFVFATKLLHTLDDGNPIFDSRVAKVVGRPVNDADKDTRIRYCIEFYAQLKNTYHDLLEEDGIKKVIQEFRKKFHVTREQISDEKVLDFIIWTLGKLKS